MPRDHTPEALATALTTVAEAVAVLLDTDEDALTAQTRLPDVDGWDSVNSMRLLVCLERELGSPLDYERFAAADTLGELAALVAGTADALAGGTP